MKDPSFLPSPNLFLILLSFPLFSFISGFLWEYFLWVNPNAGHNVPSAGDNLLQGVPSHSSCLIINPEGVSPQSPENLLACIISLGFVIIFTHFAVIF